MKKTGATESWSIPQRFQINRLAKKVGYVSGYEAISDLLTLSKRDSKRLSREEAEIVIGMLQRIKRLEDRESGKAGDPDKRFAQVTTGLAGGSFLLGSTLGTIVFAVFSAFLWFVTIAQWRGWFQEDGEDV